MTDWEEKFHETIRQGVMTKNVTSCIGVTSFIVALLRRTKYESYNWLIKNPQLSNKVRKRLRSALTEEGTLDLQTLWPKLSVIFHGGVVRELYEPILYDIAGDIHIHEAYAGTEGCYGMQLYEDMKGVVPPVDITYFEFAEIEHNSIKIRIRQHNIKSLPLKCILIDAVLKFNYYISCNFVSYFLL